MPTTAWVTYFLGGLLALGFPAFLIVLSSNVEAGPRRQAIESTVLLSLTVLFALWIVVMGHDLAIRILSAVTALLSIRSVESKVQELRELPR